MLRPTLSLPLPVPPPVPEQEAAPYWEAAARGDLVLPFCDRCGELFWYPRGFCPTCGAPDVEWRPATGRGAVYSFTVVRRALGGWRDQTPYVVAMIRLVEGPVVTANLVGPGALDVAIDDRVRAVFESSDATDALPELRFEVDIDARPGSR